MNHADFCIPAKADHAVSSSVSIRFLRDLWALSAHFSRKKAGEGEPGRGFEPRLQSRIHAALSRREFHPLAREPCRNIGIPDRHLKLCERRLAACRDTERSRFPRAGESSSMPAELPPAATQCSA